ncbi:DUF4328 domain-containing protein [Streptomyces sp. NBC_00386]|jgi:hypothetical protein|uniref:DUF4328 domain-containing protein n=1 Tax=Streptomyces sp. NBC_00386 TaxID=2975734 RepID=UPI002E1B4CBF
MTMPPSPQPAEQGAAARPPLPPLPPLPSPHGPAWLRSPVALGRATAALLGLVIAADLFGVWADYNVYDVTSTATIALAGGESLASLVRRADQADALNAAAGYAQTAALVVAAAVYLVWFLRVRVNAEVFNPFGHTHSRAWAGWGWFVPFVNLVRPRRVMAEIWDASRPAGTRSRLGLVNAWWTFWLIGLLVGRFTTTAARKAETAQQIQDAAFQLMIADGLDIVAAVLAIAVVLKLTRMQDRKAKADPVAVDG